MTDIEKKIEEEFEAWAKINYIEFPTHKEVYDHEFDRYFFSERAYKASALSREQKIIKLKEDLAYLQKCVFEEDERNEELESYKRDWQSIAGKANLVGLVSRLEKYEAVIKDLGEALGSIAKTDKTDEKNEEEWNAWHRWWRNNTKLVAKEALEKHKEVLERLK